MDVHGGAEQDFPFTIRLPVCLARLRSTDYRLHQLLIRIHSRISWHNSCQDNFEWCLKAVIRGFCCCYMYLGNKSFPQKILKGS